MNQVKVANVLLILATLFLGCTPIIVEAMKIPTALNSVLAILVYVLYLIMLMIMYIVINNQIKSKYIYIFATVCVGVVAFFVSGEKQFPTKDEYLEYQAFFEKTKSNKHTKFSKMAINVNNSTIQRIKTNITNDTYKIHTIEGPAGIGKSFTKRALKKLVPKEQVLSVDLCEKDKKSKKTCGNSYWASGWSQHKNSINNIPKATQINVNILFTNNPQKKLFLIDGLDEVHPDTSSRFLFEIDQVQPKAHVVILGRPEAFNKFSTRKDKSTKSKWEKRFRLEKLEINSDTMIDEAVEDWYKYNGNGMYDDSPQKLIQLKRALKDYGSDNIERMHFLRYSMGNLKTMNDVISRFALYLKNNSEYKNGDLSEDLTVDKIKKSLFSSLSERATKTHGRPPANTRNDYQKALEQIAIKYANKDTFYFRVNENDTTSVGTEVYSNKDLLNYSGLVDLQPSHLDIYEYSFEPVWIQKYLIDRSIQAKKKSNWYLSQSILNIILVLLFVLVWLAGHLDSSIPDTTPSESKAEA